MAYKCPPKKVRLAIEYFKRLNFPVKSCPVELLGAFTHYHIREISALNRYITSVNHAVQACLNAGFTEFSKQSFFDVYNRSSADNSHDCAVKEGLHMMAHVMVFGRLVKPSCDYLFLNRTYPVSPFFAGTEAHAVLQAALKHLTSTGLSRSPISSRSLLLRRFALWCERNDCTAVTQDAVERFYNTDNLSTEQRGQFRLALKHIAQGSGIDLYFPGTHKDVVRKDFSEALQFEDDRGSDNTPRIDVLIAKAELSLRCIDLSASRFEQYESVWQRFAGAARRQNIKFYDQDFAERFVADDIKYAQQQKLTWRVQIIQRAMRVLELIARDGIFDWNKARVHLKLDNKWQEQMRERVKHWCMDVHGLRKSTHKNYDFVLRTMFKVLDLNTAEDLRRLQYDAITKLLETISRTRKLSTLAAFIGDLKRLLTYLYEEGYTELNLKSVLMSPFVGRSYAPPYFDKPDQTALIAAFEALSLRDKAIAIGALGLGLRTSDLLNLKLSDIDWDREQINIVQLKTGVPQRLPLLKSFGNALYDYIVKERPRDVAPEHEDFVFLRSRAPYQNLSNVNFFSNLLEKQQIQPHNRPSQGLHTLRYSLVYRLICNEVPHQVITDVLGHANSDSDGPYLATDHAMLAKCALSLSLLGIGSLFDGTKRAGK